MSQGLDVIIIDDEEMICEVLSRQVAKFYTMGEVYTFTDPTLARTFCFNRKNELAIFVIDVFLGQTTAFDFIEAVSVHYPMAADDTIIITGNADSDVVNMCLAAGVNHLLEKPIKPFAFQLAVRAIAAKYTRFARKLMKDPALVRSVERMEAPNS